MTKTMTMTTNGKINYIGSDGDDANDYDNYCDDTDTYERQRDAYTLSLSLSLSHTTHIPLQSDGEESGGY